MRTYLLKVGGRLHLDDGDVITESHALQSSLSNFLEMVEVLVLIMHGAPSVLVAVHAELHLDQELHNINFIIQNAATLLN